jgi:hypothetical protein
VIYYGIKYLSKNNIALPYTFFLAVSVFRAHPFVVSKGSYFVDVSVRRAFEAMNTDDKKHFVHGELHLLQVKIIYPYVEKQKHLFMFILQKNVQIDSVRFTSQSSINFTQLESSNEYAIRLVFFESNNLHDLYRSPQIIFQTEKCLDLSIQEG